MSGAEQVYVDIGFVRIQQYLARTSRLRGRRSASAGLAEATDATAVAARLTPDLAVVNDEAGAADGVVSLRLADPRPEGREERVRQVVEQVFGLLREEFPAAELQAVWGAGESYVSAYAEQIGPAKQRGQVWYDLPALPEFPAARLCPVCNLDPATEAERLPERPEAPELVCADCARRLRRAARHSGRAGTAGRAGGVGGGRRRLSAEERLQQALEVDEAPDALENLAPLGAPGRKRNHLATIYVDGNAVGLFFRHLVAAAAGRPELHELRRDLSRQLSTITADALEWGTCKVVHERETMSAAGGEGGNPLPVVPHVVGGDDVVVSVPASYAWLFLVSYLRRFDCHAREQLVDPVKKQHGIEVPAPSASAGVVFAHHSEPMYVLLDLAEERLRAAKRATGGRASSVDFLDLTRDGPLGSDDPPLPLARLTAGTTLKALDRLASLSGSHRARLAEALRDHGDELSGEALAQRVGTFDVVRPFLPSDKPSDTKWCGIRLGHALRITHWWLPLASKVGKDL